MGFCLRKHTAQTVSPQHCRLPAPRRARSAVHFLEGPSRKVREARPGNSLHMGARGVWAQLKAQAEWAERWNRVRCRACSGLSRATYVDVHGTWCPPHPAHAPADAAPPIRLWCRHSSHRVLITILPHRSRSDDSHAFRHTLLHTTPPVGHLTCSRLQLCVRRRQGYFQYLSGASAHEGTAGGGALFKSTAPCSPSVVVRLVHADV